LDQDVLGVVREEVPLTELGNYDWRALS